MLNHPGKILLLWDRMGDYHRARWQSLSDIIGSHNCHAADYGTADKIYKWPTTNVGNNYHCLVNKPVEEVSAAKALLAFRKVVIENKISTVCVPGYGRLAYILMMAWAKSRGLRVLMCAESWYERNKFIDYSKGLLIRLLADACFVSGKRAYEHFTKRLKYPSERVIPGYSVVDNSHFATAGRLLNGNEKPQLICVARYATEKNLEFLIEAFKKSRLRDGWQLRLVGGGPGKGVLQHLAQGYDILVDDWLPYHELPGMYGRASCFILPSRFEPWGLVVNEAMAAGLPVILSDQVGALPDLLTSENGWYFKHDSIGNCVTILDKLWSTPAPSLQQMGNRSRQIIMSYSLENWAGKIALWV